MRTNHEALQTYLRDRIRSYRTEHNLTQAAMADVLDISTRSYNEQERGRTGFSALSLVFFLLALTEEQVDLFLSELRTLFEKADEPM